MTDSLRFNVTIYFEENAANLSPWGKLKLTSMQFNGIFARVIAEGFSSLLTSRTSNMNFTAFDFCQILTPLNCCGKSDIQLKPILCLQKH